MLFILFALMALQIRSHADNGDAKLNCKITVRTKLKNGKTKVGVDRVEAVSREDCKRQAKERELKTDDDVARTTASWGWSE